MKPYEKIYKNQIVRVDHDKDWGYYSISLIDRLGFVDKSFSLSDDEWEQLKKIILLMED